MVRAIVASCAGPERVTSEKYQIGCVEAIVESRLARAQASANGVARIRLDDGTTRTAELHWYEAHGIGRKEVRIKRFIS